VIRVLALGGGVDVESYDKGKLVPVYLDISIESGGNIDEAAE
jgi:hypothetical protein